VLLRCAPEALATVNAVAVRETLLRNGDTIGIGSAKIQFWFAPTRQRALVTRELFTWGLVAAISLVQVALVYILRAWE
jgi:hypothetical protein